MHFENETGIFPDRSRVVLERGLVCCADLAQFRASCLDHFANAKASADLHQFAARNNDLRFLSCEMSNDEHQCGRAIIYRRHCFCPAKQRQSILDISTAVTALARFKVVFEVRIMGTDFVERANCFVCKGRAPEIRVNHDSGSIDDRLEPAGTKLIKGTAEMLDNGAKIKDLTPCSHFRKLPADNIYDDHTRQIVIAERLQNFADRGDFPGRATFYV